MSLRDVGISADQGATPDDAWGAIEADDHPTQKVSDVAQQLTMGKDSMPTSLCLWRPWMAPIAILNSASREVLELPFL
jgi:hypothetical protein